MLVGERQRIEVLLRVAQELGLGRASQTVRRTRVVEYFIIEGGELVQKNVRSAALRRAEAGSPYSRSTPNFAPDLLPQLLGAGGVNASPALFELSFHGCSFLLLDKRSELLQERQ